MGTLSQPDEEALAQIGDIVTTFAVLEEAVSSLIAVLLHVEPRVATIMVGDMPFGRKLALARSLSEDRMASTEHWGKIRRRFEQIRRVQERRNAVVHSLWVSETQNGMARMTADWRKGVRRRALQIRAEDLENIAAATSEAIDDVLQIWRTYTSHREAAEK